MFLYFVEFKCWFVYNRIHLSLNKLELIWVQGKLKKNQGNKKQN